ncbi:MAG: hypothetical protein NTZ79_01705, partial [Proteobacteria bacterium]|nr:hypothetical protein [Pseudomonadota bacterium]
MSVVQRLSALPLLCTFALLCGCATTGAPPSSANDWPMVPSTPSNHPGPKSDMQQKPSTALAEAAAEMSADSLVSLPLPPDGTPLAELPNV